MNIEEAKKQVKYAVISYLSKDEFGEYRIPVERQRPIFLMGPPGIGKTDIMNQVAEEMNIAVVSYSMSHHTRQSALGLPFIADKEYGGRKYRTTEYTMSEIIASLYDVMEETGKAEGILFLDEINCVSETLAPSMLQFLQYKVFGRHSIPDGWVIVTAGNPPEYNNSVREFDLATLDRLKRIDVEPDFGAWWKYAQNQEVHTAVLTYLEIKKDDFYSVETTVDGKEFVTARSWVDLSDMMKLYEEHDIPVNTELIRQYVQNERIARDFSAYYDLFYRYRKDYRIDDILKGAVEDGVRTRAQESSFDERITVIRLLMDSLSGELPKGQRMRRSAESLSPVHKRKQPPAGCRVRSGGGGDSAGDGRGYRCKSSPGEKIQIRFRQGASAGETPSEIPGGSVSHLAEGFRGWNDIGSGVSDSRIYRDESGRTKEAGGRSRKPVGSRI